MSVSFAMAQGRSLHFKIYSMNQLQALAKAFAGSDRAGGEIARAVNEGYCRNPRPAATDPKVLFVVYARVDIGPDSKALYTVLFSLNAKFFELLTKPAPNDGYSIVKFRQMSSAEFTGAAKFYENQTQAEFGREDAAQALFDSSPSPSSDTSSMPSGGSAPIGKMDEYMNGPKFIPQKPDEYAQTHQFLGGRL